MRRVFPTARVVTALNTLTASLMVDPMSLGESRSSSLARGAEMMLPNWLRLMGALGTAQFSFKVVR